MVQFAEAFGYRAVMALLAAIFVATALCFLVFELSVAAWGGGRERHGGGGYAALDGQEGGPKP